MLSASAAPRWKRQMSVLPLGALSSSAPNVVRRRKPGLKPSVTSASAPDFTKTLRSMTISSPTLEFRRAEREANDLCDAVQLRKGRAGTTKRIVASGTRVPSRLRVHRDSHLAGLHFLQRILLVAHGDSLSHERVLPGKENRSRVRRCRPAKQQRDDCVDLLLRRCCPQGIEGRDRRKAHTGQPAGGNGDTEVDSIENRARMHPGLARLRPSVRSLMSVDRLAEICDHLRGSRSRIGLRIHRSQRADYDLERRLHLASVRRAREKLIRLDDRSDNLADVPVGSKKNRCGFVDERLRRIVGYETPRELGRDVPGSRRMPRHDIEYRFAVLDAAARG